MPSGRTALWGRFRLAVALTFLALAMDAGVAQAASYRGKPLAAALLDLRSLGLKVVFTSRVVRPELRVLDEPKATRPRDLLDELLAPHGLRAQDGPRGTIVILPSRVAPRAEGEAAARVRQERASPSTTPPPRQTSTPSDSSAPTTMFSDQLLVTPSRFSLLDDRAALGLSNAEILALPHLGDDFFRAITLLPGATANDTSAQFHLRGGRRDEVRVMLDGQELYDPYHLQDFDRALSFVSPSTLGGAVLETGGFSVEHGDRMGGVLDLTTIHPEAPPSFRLGLGVLNGQVGAAGRVGDRIGWLAEARRGSIDLVGRLLGQENPRFWDVFAKVDGRLDDRQTLSARWLHSDDELSLSERVAGETDKLFSTEYESSYAWLTHEAIVGDGVLLATAASVSEIGRDRRGIELEEDTRFAIDDRRSLRVGELRQHADFQPTPSQLVSVGIEIRRFDISYDYRGTRAFDSPLARLRHDFGREATDFVADFEERHRAYFVTDRWRVDERLTLELGARLDTYTQTDERRVSPRASLAYALGDKGVLRASWGRFEQSQRPNELQVEDGDTTFRPVERAEHRVLGFERQIAAKSSGGTGTTLRLELYERRVANPRPRYENLFEPLNAFPEVEPDRIVVVPERSRARGLELFVRSRSSQRLGWWASYSLARSEDLLSDRWVPRAFDETHAVKIDLDWKLGTRWSANFGGRFHTGWPTTSVSLRTEVDSDGEIHFVPVLGPLQAERLPPYHRLDMRLSRRSMWRGAEFDVYLDVQNLYGRRNVGGFDLDLDEQRGRLRFDPERGAGVLPSFGIRVEF